MKIEGPITNECRDDLVAFLQKHSNEDNSIIGIVNILLTGVNRIMYVNFRFEDKEHYRRVLEGIYAEAVKRDMRLFDTMQTYEDLMGLGKDE